MRLKRCLLSVGLVVSANQTFANDFLKLYPDVTPAEVEAARSKFAGSDYLNVEKTTEERIADLVSKMTLDEKISYMSGTTFGKKLVIGETKAIPRLGIPKFKMTDATLGSKLTKDATLFPSYINLAATFNPDLAYKYGKSVAEECRADGFRILLGPGVNMYRVPHCGRNFEYLGEDPFLASKLVVPYIRGVQDNGVIATVKHLAINNSEYFRKNSNSVIDERTMREIYFPPFKAAIQEANSAALMTSYNLINGEWAPENKWLVTDLLRNEWGFKGMVMTDWWSVYNTSKLLKSGLDIEMPSGQVLSPKRIEAALSENVITEAEIDERIKCILRPCIEFGLLDNPHADPSLRETWGEHQEVAKQIGRESLVLLKNQNNILPLNRDKIKTIALLGKNAKDTVAVGGGAAGFPPGKNFITYEQAIKKAAGENVKVTFNAQPNYKPTESADIAIVFMTMVEHEQMDRNFKFDEDSLYLLNRVATLNPNTIAVVSLGGGAEMASWVDKVPALIYAWYPGTYGAEALGQMLFGDINPSGKLPISIEKREEDTHYYGNFLPENTILPRTFPSWDSQTDVFDINYREGIFTGYRWYDSKNIEPLFPFGFGLSYTTFDYYDIAISTDGLENDEVAKISFTIQNSGKVAGAEIAQLYIHDKESSEHRPLKELKGFKRVELEPGEKEVITLTITKKDLSFWNPKSGNWVAEKGDFEILVGASSRDIKLKQNFTF